MEEIKLVKGTVRNITHEEKKRYKTAYKYAVVEPYEYYNGNFCIIVKEGFLTDGATGGPDFGCSWMFHDYLYATHEFTSGQPCTREQADEVMETIIKKEREEESILASCYAVSFKYAVSKLSYWNPCWCFSRAWNSSGERGPEYCSIIESECEEENEKLPTNNSPESNEIKNERE